MNVGNANYIVTDIVIEWTCQVQVALGDQDQSRPYDMKTPIDEFEFWKYRCKYLFNSRSDETIYYGIILFLL